MKMFCTDSLCLPTERKEGIMPSCDYDGTNFFHHQFIKIATVINISTVDLSLSVVSK